MEVNNSARGRRWKIRDLSESEVAKMVQQTGVSELTARALIVRGVASEHTLAHLDPRLRTFMPDPMGITDMERAVTRIAQAVCDEETIGIISDYDVDGITSLALMRNFLRSLGLDPITYIPCRLSEGYGPSTPAVDEMSRQGVKLLLTLDCGTTSHSALNQASSSGMDVVVIDHHQMAEELPNVFAVVNPNRLDDNSDLGYLAACGVVFMLLVALRRALISMPETREIILDDESEPDGITLSDATDRIDLLGYLDLVALGTMCDVVPLKNLNRAFVRQGMRLIQQSPRPGIAALMEASRVRGVITTRHLSFSLGPRINAAGRLGEVHIAEELLDDNSTQNHAALAHRLNDLNMQRQKLENAIITHALHFAQEHVERGKKIICVSDEHWHRGVLGLVAGRIRSKYQCPAIAVTFADGLSLAQQNNNSDPEGVGSARAGSSGPGNEHLSANIDIGELIRTAAEENILISGGGHSAAGGFRVLRSKWADFCAFAEDFAEQERNKPTEKEPLWLEGIIGSGTLSAESINQLTNLGPFGAGSEEPLFMLCDRHVVDLQTFGDGHLRCSLHGHMGIARAVAFRAYENGISEAMKSGRRIHVAAAFDVGPYGPQARIIDVAISA